MSRWCGLGLVVAFVVLNVSTRAQAQACLPDCRSGYTCIQGACVSACNPPCAADEICTAQASCELRNQPPPRDPLALAQSTWFMHTFAGIGLWAIDRGENPTYLAVDTPPAENLEALAPSIGVGLGIRHAVNRVIGFRSTLLLAGGSDFGDHSGYTVMLDGRFRLGPVAERFPWFFGVGPVVGVAGFRGTFPNIDGKRGGDSFARAGFVADMGFAFDEDYDIELSVETRIIVVPMEDVGGTLLAGVGLTIGL